MKKMAIVSKECVACGCCIKACPLKIITINQGIQAKINEVKCVGCGKCALVCPADVISIVPREEK